MPESHPPPRAKNYLRRTAGAAICLTPAVAPTASLAYGLVDHKSRTIASIIFVSLAAVFAACSFYLSFGRPLLFRLRHGTLEGYRFVSGIPVIGNILALIGIALGFGAIDTAFCAIIVVALDTAGLPWFLVATWRDVSLWDGRHE